MAKNPMQDQLNQRVKLFRDQTDFKKTERIPHFASAVTWKIFDAGHTPDEALTDFKVMEECVRHFLDTYPVDGVSDLGIRNQFNVTEAFGSEGYYYYTKDVVGIKDHAHCTLETLDEYMDDPDKYVWEKILPNKYGEDWEKKDLATWKKAFQEYMNYTKFIIHMGSVATKEYGLPSLSPNNPAFGSIDFGIEELMANLLGIKQLSLALRRGQDQLDRFVERWDAQKIDPLIAKVKKKGAPNYKYAYDASLLMLAHTIMGPKQFERYYWPRLEKLLDAYEEKGMHVRIFTEGAILRYADYFKKYKKGTLTFHLEQDDPFEVRKELPNVAIMGGMTTDMLGNGTAQECVEYAKRLCDELGKDGGFIFSENKMLSYRNDAKSENMAAVCKFVNEYRL